MLWGRLLSIALLLSVAACTGTATRDNPSPDWTDRLDTLRALDAWAVSGKLALRSDVASETANLSWEQLGDYAHLELRGPLGIGATTIDSDGRHLHIQQNGETRVLDISTPTAIKLNTGWDLPLAALPHWLRGMPSPAFAVQAQAFDESGSRLQTLEQDNWEVEFLDYAEFAGLALPTRMTVRRDTTRVKLVLRNWREITRQ